jgi:cob(I)alamin adenosyltransferase
MLARVLKRSFKIYTKTGDKGTSALYTGERLAKDSQVFQTLGAIDEVNSMLGLAREYMSKECEHTRQIEEIQCRLIDVGSHVATPRSSDHDKKVQHTSFPQAHTDDLERWID